MTSNCFQTGKNFETLVKTIKMYSQDIRMKFSLEKCSILIMRSGKKTNNASIRTARPRKNPKAWRKVLRNIRSGHCQISEDEKITKKIVS